MKHGVSLKIHSPNLVSDQAVVELDGVDITRNLTALTVQLKAGEITTATFTIIVHDLDVYTKSLIDFHGLHPETSGDDKCP